MELMHDFVKECMYITSGMYIFSRGTGYLVCDARVEWMTKHYNLNTPGSHINQARVTKIMTIQKTR